LDRPPETVPERVSGWAIGGFLFAATMLITVGIFHAIAGVVAIFDEDFYLETVGYTFDLDDTAWGFGHVAMGALLIFAGWSLMQRATWAMVFAITVAIISMVLNFFFIPYYPFWSLVVIALDAWVIWSLTRPGYDREF
jgi:hypothetical protein